MDTLNREFDYYITNQKELVKKYKNKFLIIKEQSVIGDYDSFDDALNAAIKKFEVGTFLIQHCTPGEDSYTQIFHSRAIFI
jgi:hypothetical protein